MTELKGVMALTYSALNPDYSLNENGICQDIDWVLAQGAAGIWPGGYAANWPELTEEQKKQLLRISIEHARGQTYFAAGCHATNTLETIRLVNYAETLGYDCAWISPTLPRKSTDAEIIRHHRMVMENTSMPVAIYDSSPITNYLSPRLIGEIVALSERIVAMKAIIGDIGHIAGLHNGSIDRQVSIFGIESNMLEHLMLGSPGGMGGSEWIPILCALHRAFSAGDMRRAWSLQKTILAQCPLILPRAASQAMGGHAAHSGIGYMKEKFRQISGIDLGSPMPPHEAASADEIVKARADIEALQRAVREVT